VCRALGIDDATLVDLSWYARSDRFTPLEKAALDLAVDMTGTPAQVSDAVRRRLLAELTPGQFAELASSIAWENHRARLNRALGVRAMGFAEGGFCVLPERAKLSPARSGEYPAKPGEGVTTKLSPRSRGSTRRSRGRG